MRILYKLNHLNKTGRFAATRLFPLASLLAVVAFGGLGCPGGIGDGGAGPAPAPALRAFAYVTNLADNTVSAYTVDSSSGALTSTGTWKTGQTPIAVAAVSIDKAGFVYVANKDDNTISQYKFDSGGRLTPLSPPTVSTGSGPVTLVAGYFGSIPDILVANNASNTISDYNITANGTLNLKQSFSSGGTQPVKITVAADGTAFYVLNAGNNNLVGFSEPTNGFTQTSKLALPSSFFPLDLTSDDVADLYAVESRNNTLAKYATRLTTGTISSQQSMVVANTPVSVAVVQAIHTGSSSLDAIFVGSSAGYIYQYQKPTANVAAALTAQSAAPVTFPAQQVVLRAGSTQIPATQYRLYALLTHSNTVRVYAADKAAIGAASSETATGQYPSDIAFTYVTESSATVQTIVK